MTSQPRLPGPPTLVYVYLRTTCARSSRPAAQHSVSLGPPGGQLHDITHVAGPAATPPQQVGSAASRSAQLVSASGLLLRGRVMCAGRRKLAM